MPGLSRSARHVQLGRAHVSARMGYYVPYGNPIKTYNTIAKALKTINNSITRERIKKLFHPIEREKKLIDLINNINWYNHLTTINILKN